jgi:hypothetical protein
LALEIGMEVIAELKTVTGERALVTAVRRCLAAKAYGANAVFGRSAQGRRMGLSGNRRLMTPPGRKHSIIR